MKIIMFGAPGSGKGTISKQLEAALGIPHVSTGDMLRSAVEGKTDLGLEVEDLMGTGTLIPDKIIDGVVRLALTGKESFILDGYPRTVAQAKYSMGFLVPDIALHLQVSTEVLVERMLRRATIEGREDDTQEVIDKRLDVYNQKTLPILQYFALFHKDKFGIFPVRGEQGIKATAESALQILNDQGLI